MKRLTHKDLMYSTWTGDETFYLASEVDARIAELEKALSRAIELFQDECDPVTEPDSYAWLQSTRELMDGRLR